MQHRTTNLDGEILALGDPRLRWPSKAIPDARAAGVRALAGRMHEVLAEFRAERGFGRALSAPQIGRRVRMVAFRARAWLS